MSSQPVSSRPDRFEQALRVDTLQAALGHETASAIWKDMLASGSRLVIVLPPSNPVYKITTDILPTGVPSLLYVAGRVGPSALDIPMDRDLILFANPRGEADRLPLNFYATRMYELYSGPGHRPIRGHAAIIRREHFAPAQSAV